MCTYKTSKMKHSVISTYKCIMLIWTTKHLGHFVSAEASWDIYPHFLAYLCFVKEASDLASLMHQVMTCISSELNKLNCRQVDSVTHGTEELKALGLTRMDYRTICGGFNIHTKHLALNPEGHQQTFESLRARLMLKVPQKFSINITFVYFDWGFSFIECPGTHLLVEESRQRGRKARICGYKPLRSMLYTSNKANITLLIAGVNTTIIKHEYNLVMLFHAHDIQKVREDSSWKYLYLKGLEIPNQHSQRFIMERYTYHEVWVSVMPGLLAVLNLRFKNIKRDNYRQLSVYDGPSVNAPILYAHAVSNHSDRDTITLKASTHLALLVLEIATSSSGHKVFDITYRHEIAAVRAKYTLTNVTDHVQISVLRNCGLSLWKQSSFLCTFSFVTMAQQAPFLTFSIDDFSGHFYDDEFCILGGVALNYVYRVKNLLFWNAVHHPNVVFCESHHIVLDSTVYTSSDALIVGFYMFSSYMTRTEGKPDVVYTVAPSKCQGFHIQSGYPPSYESNCWVTQYHQQIKWYEMEIIKDEGSMLVEHIGRNALAHYKMTGIYHHMMGSNSKDVRKYRRCFIRISRKFFLLEPQANQGIRALKHSLFYQTVSMDGLQIYFPEQCFVEIHIESKITCELPTFTKDVLSTMSLVKRNYHEHKIFQRCRSSFVPAARRDAFVYITPRRTFSSTRGPCITLRYQTPPSCPYDCKASYNISIFQSKRLKYWKRTQTYIMRMIVDQRQFSVKLDNLNNLRLVVVEKEPWEDLNCRTCDLFIHQEDCLLWSDHRDPEDYVHHLFYPRSSATDIHLLFLGGAGNEKKLGNESDLFKWESHERKYLIFKRGLWSWEQADQLCRKYNSSLLRFRTKHEETTFHVMLEEKFVEGLMPHAVHFIDIKWENRSQAMLWSDGTPVTYQGWNRLFSPKNPFQIQFILKDRKEDESNLPVSSFLNQNSSTAQPGRSTGPLCGMVAGIPLANYTYEWLMVSCDQTFDLPFICHYSSTPETHGDTNAPDPFKMVTVIRMDGYEVAKKSQPVQSLSAQPDIIYECDAFWFPQNNMCYNIVRSQWELDCQGLPSGTMNYSRNDLPPLPDRNATLLSQILYNITLLYLQTDTEAFPDIMTVQNPLATNHATTCYFLHLNAKIFKYPSLFEFLPASFMIPFYPIEDKGTMGNCTHDHYILVRVPAVFFKCPLHTYQCHDKSCILVKYVCDGKMNCIHGDDEDCQHICKLHPKAIISEHSPSCDYNFCYPGDCKCTFTHFQCARGGCVIFDKVCDSTEDCHDGSDEHDCLIQPKEISYTDKSVANCTLSGEVVEQNLVNDLIPDCLDGTDETYPWINDTSFKCEDGLEQCQPQHPKCYEISNRCVYDLNAKGHIRYCRNGAHLTHCRLHVCLSMFKCVNSYCIPIQRVCDGVIDCPGQEDEHQCFNIACQGLLKCKTGVCVHPKDICDGEADCPHHADDEMYCDLQICPPDCHCSGYSALCRTISWTDIKPVHHFRFKALNLEGHLSQLNSNMFGLFNRLLHLDLSNNSIRALPGFSDAAFKHLQTLMYLNLQHNKIKLLPPECFWGLKRLWFIDLSENPVTSVSSEVWIDSSRLESLQLQLPIETISNLAFRGLKSLSLLNISHSKLKSLPNDFPLHLPSLRIFSFQGSRTAYHPPSLYKSITYLHTIETQFAEICCIAKRVNNCLVKFEKQLPNCDRLLPNHLSFLTWSLGGLIITLNVISFLLTKSKKITPDTFLIMKLHAFDGIMGVYVCSLSAADAYFGTAFALNQQWWLHSWQCTLTALIAALSIQMSICTEMLISLERFYRLSGTWPSLKGNFYISLLALGIQVCLIGAPPILLNRGESRYHINSKVCHLFNVFTISHQAWVYILYIISVLDVCAIGTTVLFYVRIHTFIRESQEILKSFESAAIQRKGRHMRKMATLACCSVATGLPAPLAIVLQTTNSSMKSNHNTIIIPIMLLVKGLVDPFIYSIVHAKEKKSN